MPLTTNTGIDREARLRNQLLQELRLMSRRVTELEAIAGRNRLARARLPEVARARASGGVFAPLRVAHDWLMARGRRL